MSIQVTIRGEQRKLEADAITVVEALKLLNIPPDLFMVIRDGLILDGDELLIDGDQVQLVGVISGGSA
ncbi:MAG: MoaD/ThiS family protein [Anaerolineae bacterium]|nr:MoaD/ThiS family protein [Anaerolineae bacterium]